MFNLNDFRVIDLDEFIFHPHKEGKPFVLEENAKHNFFRFSKTCYGSLYYDKEAKELTLYLSNALIEEKKFNYGGNSPVPLENVNLETLFENLVMLDYHVSSGKVFRNKEEYLSTAHHLLSNIEKNLEGKTTTMSARDIVGPDNYEKYLKKAKKAYQKDQEQTIDSQTPVYDT